MGIILCNQTKMIKNSSECVASLVKCLNLSKGLCWVRINISKVLCWVNPIQCGVGSDPTPFLFLSHSKKLPFRSFKNISMCLNIYFTHFRFKKKIFQDPSQTPVLKWRNAFSAGGVGSDPRQIANFESREVNFTFFPLKI